MYWGLRATAVARGRGGRGISDYTGSLAFVLGGRSLISFSALAVSLTTKVTRKRAVRALNLTLSLLRLILMATEDDACRGQNCDPRTLLAGGDLHLVSLLLTRVRNSLISWTCLG